jgi:hypothetical protein
LEDLFDRLGTSAGCGAGAGLAAVTSASKIRRSSPSSGNHCTPMPNLCPCTSTASTTWSRVQATVTSPLPMLLIAWWCAAGTWAVVPRIRESLLSGLTCTS